MYSRPASPRPSTQLLCPQPCSRHCRNERQRHVPPWPETLAIHPAMRPSVSILVSWPPYHLSLARCPSLTSQHLEPKSHTILPRSYPWHFTSHHPHTATEQSLAKTNLLQPGHRLASHPRKKCGTSVHKFPYLLHLQSLGLLFVSTT